MAKKIQQPFDFVNEVKKYTDKIRSLRYGNQVRSAIAESIEILADRAQRLLNDYVGNVITKSNEVDSAYQEVKAHYLESVGYITEMGNVVERYNSLKDAIARYTEMHVDTVDYVPTTVLNGVKQWKTPAPALQWIDNIVLVENESTHEMEEQNRGWWQWTLPKWPAFNTLNWEWVLKKPGVTYADSVEYDPNEGILTIKARDFLSDLKIITRKINYGQSPTASMVATQDGSHQLTLELPEGPRGSGAEGLSDRPYFYTLYEADDSAYVYNATTPPYFGKGPLVDLVSTFGENNQTITYLGDYFDENSNYNGVYDGVYITFRKSVDNYNNTTTLRKNFGSSPTGELAANNVDYDATVTIFLPRGESATATFIDDQGRTFCRRVHWMTKEEPWVEAVGKVDGTGKPKDNKAKVDRFMTNSQFELIKDTEGLVAAKTFNGAGDENFYMLLFEDAFMPGKGTARKGAVADWAATTDTYRTNNDVTYGQSSDFRLNNIQTSNLKAQTDDMENTNHQYDQFLIPIKVVGVSYHLAEVEIAKNIFGAIRTVDESENNEEEQEQEP